MGLFPFLYGYVSEYVVASIGVTSIGEINIIGFGLLLGLQVVVQLPIYLI